MINNLKKFYSFYKRDPAAVTNLLKLVYMTDVIAPMQFTVDMKKRQIVVDGVSFGVKDIEPFVILETFGMKIHDKVDAKRGMTVLDAGACFGDTALHFAKMGCRVYAIEPDQMNYEAMQRNILLNPDLKDKIETIKAALGKDGTIDFAYNEKGVYGGAGASYFRKGKTVSVESYSLGRMLDRLKLKHVDILKMDCKGAENFLNAEDLKRIKFSAKIEYANDDKSGESLKKLIGTMKEAGLNPQQPYKHNPTDTAPIECHGTVLGFRK